MLTFTDSPVIKIVRNCLDSLALYSFFISFSGGVAAEVGLQPAELLDDPISEAPEHQTTDSAYAGAEGLLQASDGRHDQAFSGVNLYVLAGGWRGE